MQNITNHFSKLFIKSVLNTTNLHGVRWLKRKPMHLGTAKSKLFRVPTRPNIPKEEVEELKRLFNNYRTQVKSIRTYFMAQYAAKETESVVMEEKKQLFEEDYAKCAKENEKWNEEIREIRERRVAKEMAEEIETARQKVDQILLERKSEQEELEEKIREQKAIAHTFITEENIDSAIEQALVHPVDYNYAIDLDGNTID